MAKGPAASVARHHLRVDLDDGDLGRQVHRPLRVHLFCSVQEPGAPDVVLAPLLPGVRLGVYLFLQQCGLEEFRGQCIPIKQFWEMYANFCNEAGAS